MKLSVSIPGKETYPIYINTPGSFIDTLQEHTAHAQYVFVTNTAMEKIYAPHLAHWKDRLAKRFLCCVLPDGEEYKSMDSVLQIVDFMLENRCDRNSVVIAFGGGVIGDMAGFAAAIFLRGVPYVQLPTTLLAMVDSSVGGKTGVNHTMGKNLIGSFYQPRFVWADPSYLATLPERHYRAGCGEILKYGFIGGEQAFTFMTEHFQALCDRDPRILQDAIALSVEIKAQIVAQDEKEQGKRALLNLGHTFGHALEHELGYGAILHGEAVFWGLECAVELALEEGLIPSEDIPRIKSLQDNILHPPLPRIPAPEDLYRAMKSDKKVQQNTMRFVLPEIPGYSGIFSEIPKESVLSVLKRVLGR
ncbi:MAG: 3-dehydroquinate synthase [Fibrobacterota bacterium]